MSQAVETYLERVMQCAAIDDRDEAAAIREEQRDHLEEKIERLKAEGIAAEDAVFQTLDEHGDAVTVGYGLRPRMRLIDVRAKGTARGIVAIGPKAVGVFAFGGVAAGVFAFGGVTCGVFTIGGLSFALLFSWSGFAVVPLGVAYAGVGLALVAIGGYVSGIVAAGAYADGVYAIGGNVATEYTTETAPEWMQSVMTTLPPLVEMPAFHIGCIVLMLVLLGFSNVKAICEARRIQKISPRSI